MASGKIRLSPASWSFAALVMLSQCVCQNNRPGGVEAVKPVDGVGAGSAHAASPKPDPTPPPVAKKKEPVKLPASLDTKDLDDDEKAVLGDVLSDQFDPCGKSRSFLDSLNDPQTCPTAKKLGAMAVEKIAQGLSKKQVIQELLKEQARWASKADFDLSDVPVMGTPAPGKRVVVEFSDFQCPHCKMAAKPVKDLVAKYGAVLYSKMLPLDFHPVARQAALAALAASRQGKFWEVSESFFEHQETLSPESVRELVQKAGVDMAKFDKDLADPATEKLLTRDLDESKKLKIDGTPTFYVDGFQVEFEQLEATLKAPPQQ
ncbi:MAG: thioredoxin domain-containing protein [Myxococcota bacterium]